jgi:Zn finger protein HypA/HybF involved in hydrogenase expression
MFFRSRTKPAPAAKDLARQASLAFDRVREHWASCPSCREAAAASATLWCAVGLDLMKQGIAEHAHWDACPRCKSAQERVQAGQCDQGRDLEREYRALAQD